VTLSEDVPAYARRVQLRVGDLFLVPIDEARVALGQAAALYGQHAYFFAVFELVMHTENVAVDLALASPVSFMALSFDAKVAAGDWPIIGNRAVDPAWPLPAYKEIVSVLGRVEIVDHSGTRRRPARGTEAEWVPNRTIVAPIRIERAVRARQGLGPWREEYERLRPSLATTARLFALD
jgi:hypothetical protein